MIDQKNKMNLGELVFDDNSQDKKTLFCLRRIRSRYLIVFFPNFCHFVDYLWLLLENSSFTNLWQFNCSRWETFVIELDKLYTDQIYEIVFFEQTCVFLYLVIPSWTKNEKSQLWLKIGTFRTKFGYFFRQHSQPLHDVLQEDIENLEFSLRGKFEFVDSLKNNGT